MMASRNPSTSAPRSSNTSIVVVTRSTQEAISVVPADSIVQSSRLTCINEAQPTQQAATEIPRWRDELGDLSLGGFPDAIGTSPTYSDVSPFVNRLTNDPNEVHTRNSSQSLSSNSAHHFQYMLMAPTSAAVPINEESLTYLNQHQSYEIQCKKMSASHQGENVLYRTVVSLCFHNRRQRFEERDLMEEWRKCNPDVKPIDIDLPLSINVYQTFVGENYVEFLWDPSPTKMTMLFVKIALLSTHFTQKKQGGEKGIPFRLVINTFTHDGRDTKQVHSAFAQIRVFKLKGADRKNKTDRERAEKHNDREHFQPAYDYTIFAESFPLEAANMALPSNDKDSSDVIVGEQLKLADDSNEPRAATPVNATTEPSSMPDDDAGFVPTLLNCNASVSAANEWLKQNGFAPHLHLFEHFNGVDLLRLNQNDLESLFPSRLEGIRLYNALHAKPRLTIFIRRSADTDSIHTAFFLHKLTVTELKEKLKELIKEDTKEMKLVVIGPGEIKVMVTDEMISNWADRSVFSLSLTDATDGSRQLILRQIRDLNSPS